MKVKYVLTLKKKTRDNLCCTSVMEVTQKIEKSTKRYSSRCKYYLARGHKGPVNKGLGASGPRGPEPKFNLINLI
jgi:hypothetical protein